MAKGEEKSNIQGRIFSQNPQASRPAPGGAADMNISSPSPVRAAGLILWILVLSAPASTESPDGSSAPRPSADLRAEASTREGCTAALDLAAGSARLSARLSAVPGESPEARIGTTGPLWTAGPVRHSGLARLLADPCADAYLFTGAGWKPLVLDFDARGYGFFAGDSVGVWIQDADAPRMGFWAGTARNQGILAGAGAALSLLPPKGGFDSWFAPEVPLPARPLAAGTAWAGYGFPAGRVIAAGVVSQEDRGARGWAVRAEGDWGRRGFSASGRVSSASPGWRGLDGEAADRWEARADVSWVVLPRFRLEGRARVGQDPDCGSDWEALGRASWNGRVWRWGAELGSCDAARFPPIRLDPAVWAGFERNTVRTAVRASWVREGPDLTRTEVSAALDLKLPRAPGFRLEGARRWTIEGPFWKASVDLGIPTARCAWAVRAGTGGWRADGAPVSWEAAVSLRCRVP